MEYLYAALLIHKSGNEITIERVTSVLESATFDVDKDRVQKLVKVIQDIGQDNLDGTIKEYINKLAYGVPGVKADIQVEKEPVDTSEDDEDDEPKGISALFG